MKFGAWIATVCLAASLTACAHSKIRGTSIKDTDENREIWELVEKYRNAVEQRDIETLIEMLSKNYYEDNGNADSSDDYGYEEIQSSLRAHFAITQDVKFIIRVDDIVVEGKKAYAELFFDLRRRMNYPAGSRWQRSTDRVRLTFERDPNEEKWLVIAGL